MGREIERKFLVKDDAWRAGARGTAYRQGYLSAGGGPTVRVRVAGEKGYLTIKGKAVGTSRAEYEYEIPLADAEEMLATLAVTPIVEKVRYRVEHGGLVWEVDEFGGANRGLIVAEVELQEEGQRVELPAWVGEEVTADRRYTNASLAVRPWGTWGT